MSSRTVLKRRARIPADAEPDRADAVLRPGAHGQRAAAVRRVLREHLQLQQEQRVVHLGRAREVWDGASTALRATEST